MPASVGSLERGQKELQGLKAWKKSAIKPRHIKKELH